MEAAAVMHCGSIVELKSAGLLTTRCHHNGGLRLKDACASSSSVCLRADEFSFRRSPVLEWQTLRLRSAASSVSRRRVNSFSQRIASSTDCATSDDKAALIEEEQKLLLKQKAESIVRDLRGTCIFLVGMMGSGKTTVGKYIADSLGYYFFDSDKLVEDAAGGVTVQQMFREGNEEKFRNAESEVLMQLSALGRLVVATGGGAVVRPQNWGYLRHGITVWLDVPVDALARRVVAVGCESRPLLGQVSAENAYDQALNCLENIFDERVGYYKNADACVSVRGLATMMGLEDVSAVTPAMLAVQAGAECVSATIEVFEYSVAACKILQVLEEIAILMRNRKKLFDHPGNF